MQRLILLRHAKSAWPEGVADHDRPLARRGLRAAPIIGAYVAEAGLTPELAMVSSARRTQETWALVSPAFVAATPAIVDRRIYEAPAQRLLTVIRETPDTVQTLLMVGHNPGLEELATLLIAPAPDDEFPRPWDKYPTGGLAVVDFAVASWSALTGGAGTLDRFVTPRSLGCPD